MTNSVFTTDALNCAVLDSACSSTVCGKAWFEHYLNSLEPEDKNEVKKVFSGKVFKFGAKFSFFF